MSKAPFVRLHKRDNVAVAGVDFPIGTSVEVDGVTLVIRQSIPAGHKFALVNILAGGPIIKYGEVIGQATQDIQAGEHVHLHNMQSLRDSSQVKVKLT